MNISIDIVKMEFNLMFLWCKKIIHIFFDLYEGIGERIKNHQICLIGCNRISNKKEYLFFSIN